MSLRGWLLEKPLSPSENPKRRKIGEGADLNNENRKQPSVILSWNLNGLLSRIKLGEFAAFAKFAIAEKNADVICLQEVKMPAAGPLGCIKGDGKKRDRSRLKDDTKAAAKEKDLILTTLNSLFPKYLQYWSLSDWKYSGCLVLVKEECAPEKVFFNFFREESDGIKIEHHEEGRVIILDFQTFRLLATYVPNNGWDEEHWKRRAQWHDSIEAFVRNCRSKPLVWIGDLNCARNDQDLTHPEWFHLQVSEQKRKLKYEEAIIGIPPNQRGQPGCCLSERLGLERILKAGDLVDAFKHSSAEKDVDLPKWTWRGLPGNAVAEYGRYYAKGMRIDTAFISAKWEHDFIANFEILGYDRKRINYFGSDHSPILLKKREDFFFKN